MANLRRLTWECQIWILGMWTVPYPVLILAPTSKINIRLFLELFSKKPTSRKPSGIKSKSKQLLQVIIYLSTFPKQFRTRNCFLMDFSISLLQPSSYLRKLTKTLFFNWSPLGLVLKRLCYRQVPHVGSHWTSSFVGFPTLEKRRRKDAPNLSSPNPNVRRDKILSRSGEPLTLTFPNQACGVLTFLR